MKALTKDQATQCRKIIVSYNAYNEAFSRRDANDIWLWATLLKEDQEKTGIIMVTDLDRVISHYKDMK